MFQQLRGALSRLAAAEGDGIDLALVQGGRCRLRHRGGAAGLIGRHLHHPHPGFTEGVRQQGATTALHPWKEHLETPARHREVIDQAVGHEAGWHEISARPQIVKHLRRFAAHRRNLEAGGASGQATAEALQPLFHGLYAIGTGEHQPVKAVQVFEGVIQRPPVVGWSDHQCRKVKHCCPLLLQQLASGPLLVGRAGDDHRSALQGLAQATASPSSFTTPCTLSRSCSAASALPCA